MAVVYKETLGVRRIFLGMYKVVLLSILAKLRFGFKVFLDGLTELKKCSHGATAEAPKFKWCK